MLQLTTCLAYIKKSYINNCLRIECRSPANACSYQCRLHDKDGDHTNRSAMAESPMVHANFTALSSIKPDLLPSKCYIAEIGNFVLFWSSDLDLNPMTFTDELDLHTLKTYQQNKSELSMSRLSRVIVYYTHTYTHTDRQTNATETITTPPRAWSVYEIL